MDTSVHVPQLDHLGFENLKQYLEGVQVLVQFRKGISYNTITGKYLGEISGNIKVSDLARLSEKYVDNF